MGRYYSGDIEGKFWFALQSSDAASRFGGQQFEPTYIDYYFDEEHLKDVETEIKVIEDFLGKKKQILDDFFNKQTGYTDKDILELGVSRDELQNYADLGLGIKIRDCIIANGSCSFEAEL
jgi:hypothetical protein